MKPTKSVPGAQEIRRVRLYDLSEREKDGWECVVGEMIEDIEPEWYCIDDCLLIPVRCPIPVALNALQQAKDESP